MKRVWINGLGLITLCLGLSHICYAANSSKLSLKKYDSCDGIAGNPPTQLSFPSLQKALVFFPKLLDKNPTPSKLYNNAYFNLACGGTALTGNVSIKPSKSKHNYSVFVRTCGDLALQTEEEACSVVYKGNYQPIMPTGDSNKMIIKYNRIFLINKDGSVEVSTISNN